MQQVRIRDWQAVGRRRKEPAGESELLRAWRGSNGEEAAPGAGRWLRMFPALVLLAAVGALLAVAATATAYRREAAVVDERLARKVTVAVKAAAFSDLCQRLSDDTGVEVKAGRGVADDKVTVFCKDRPLSDLMRQISRLFGFTWERSGEEGAYKYRLTQTLRAQLLEEELRNKDRNEALLALDKEMDRYRKYLGLSPEEAKAQAEGASGPDKKILESLAGTGWGPAQLYAGLSPDELGALKSGQALTFSSSPETGQQMLPPELTRNVLQTAQSKSNAHVESFPDGKVQVHGGDDPTKWKGVPLTAFPEARAVSRISLDSTDLGQLRLVGWSGYTVTGANGRYDSLWGGGLAVGVSPSVQNPRNADANAKLGGDPSLQGRVTLKPRAGCPPVTGRDEKTAASHKVTTADVLEAIHKATGRDVIGDYFTRLYAPEAVSAQNLRLFDALNRVSDTLRLRWGKENEWLRFRSAGFFNDRPQEVPNRLLTRWAAARQKQGALTLGDLAEIAQLSDAQLDSSAMAEGARACFGLAEWDKARSRPLRAHWRFLLTFSPALRQAAAGEKGLGFRQMSLAQQQQFLALAFGPEVEKLQPQWADLAGATLRVEYDMAAAKTDKGANTPPTAPSKDPVFLYQCEGPNIGTFRREVNAVGGESANRSSRPKR